MIEIAKRARTLRECVRHSFLLKESQSKEDGSDAILTNVPLFSSLGFHLKDVAARTTDIADKRDYYEIAFLNDAMRVVLELIILFAGSAKNAVEKRVREPAVPQSTVSYARRCSRK
jgi:hypothetical protein